MKNSLEAVKKAGVMPRLSLAEQIFDEGGKRKGVRGTGPKRVKLIEDRVMMGKDYHTGEERYEMHYIVEENGIKKYYPTPLKGEDGSLSYLVKKMSEFQEGDEVIMEFKRRGAAGFIDVRKVSGQNIEEAEKENDDDIPVVEEDEGTYPTPEELDEVFDKDEEI